MGFHDLHGNLAEQRGAACRQQRGFACGMAMPLCRRNEGVAVGRVLPQPDLQPGAAEYGRLGAFKLTNPGLVDVEDGAVAIEAGKLHRDGRGVEDGQGFLFARQDGARHGANVLREAVEFGNAAPWPGGRELALCGLVGLLDDAGERPEQASRPGECQRGANQQGGQEAAADDQDGGADFRVFQPRRGAGDEGPADGFGTGTAHVVIVAVERKLVGQGLIGENGLQERRGIEVLTAGTGFRFGIGEQFAALVDHPDGPPAFAARLLHDIEQVAERHFAEQHLIVTDRQRDAHGDDAGQGGEVLVRP